MYTWICATKVKYSKQQQDPKQTSGGSQLQKRRQLRSISPRALCRVAAQTHQNPLANVEVERVFARQLGGFPPKKAVSGRRTAH